MTIDYTKPKELQKLYNINKIKYDSFDYSFKDRLIFDKLKAYEKADYRTINWIQENLLCDLISTLETGVTFVPYSAPTDYETFKETFSFVDVAFIKNNNLKIDFEIIKCELRKIFYTTTAIVTKAIPDYPERVVNSKLFSAILQVLIGMGSEKTIIKHLLCLGIEQLATVKFEKLINLNCLKDSLEETATTKKVFVYSNDDYEIRDFAFKEINSKNFDFKYTSKKYIAFGIEILRIISNLEVEERDEIFNLLAKYECLDSYTKYLFTVNGAEIKILEEIQKIIDIKEPEERYEEIKFHMEFIDPSLEADSKKFELISDMPTLVTYLPNSFLDYFIKFGIDLSFKNLKICTLQNLYTYCKIKGYLVKPEVDKDAEEKEESLVETLEKEAMKDADASEKDEDTFSYDTSSMFEINELKDTTKYSKTLPKEDSIKNKTSETLEALDKLSAGYKEKEYSFEVKEVFNNNDAVKSKYMAIAKHVNIVNHNLIKGIREIKTYNTGGKEPNKSKGKIDRKNMFKYKYDKNIFFNNDYKQKELDLAFGIVLDESGSMSGQGIRDGSITMIVLHETLKALNINHSIVGHTSNGRNNVIINNYQSFKESKRYKFTKNFGLSEIYAKWGNCDSGALYYMEQALLNTKNKDRICLIFSDGQPTECTDLQLKNQVKHMESKGITVIGIGINFESIKEYYPNHANGKNLTEMLNIVTKILKQYVLDKKE